MAARTPSWGRRRRASIEWFFSATRSRRCGAEGKAKFFPGRPFLNRGIAHQTTPQMLVRFRQDVISLKPKVVVIQAGSSDLAGYAGPATEGTIAENFMSMTELAKAHDIQVVLASLTPVCDCFKNLTERRPPGKIIGLNGWLKGYAKQSGSVYLDYYTALADGRAMKKELTVDGLIPNDAGYALMAPLAEQAIAQALGKKSESRVRCRSCPLESASPDRML